MPGHHGVTNSQHRAYGNLPKRVFPFPAPHRTLYVPLLHPFYLLFFFDTRHISHLSSGRMAGSINKKKEKERKSIF